MSKIWRLGCVNSPPLPELRGSHDAKLRNLASVFNLMFL